MPHIAPIHGLRDARSGRPWRVATRLLRRLGAGAALFALAVLPAPPATGQASQVRICAADARTDDALAGATVRLVSVATTVEAVTAGDGCALLVGAFPVGTDAPDGPATALQVGAIYPNPTSGNARLPVDVPQAAPVAMAVFDALGRPVSPAHTAMLVPGRHVFDVDLRSQANGTYFVRLTGQWGSFTRQVVRTARPPTHAAPVAPAAAIASAAPNDPTRIEIEKEGFVPVTEERVLRQNETIRRALLKRTDTPVPLMDMKGVAYRGFEGGLYPDGANAMPEAHYAAGIAAARAVVPLDRAGAPDPNGRYILTSVGMSNTTREFCGVADPTDSCRQGSFMTLAAADGRVNGEQLVLVDGADPGKTAEKWVEASAKDYDRVLDEELAPFGYSERQVQVAWVKLANAPPSGTLPDSDADAFRLLEQFGQVVRALKTRYPNLRQVFFSSRIYGGYAVTDRNPEPYAYEQGFAVKWLIEAQIRQMASGGAAIDPIAGDLNYETVAPWIGWGPYMWANGAEPRSDGLVWLRSDFRDDGLHPGRTGVEKVATMLLSFFSTSPHTMCWFLAEGACR